MSTDDLLDEATRLADVAPVGSAAERILVTPRVLRALVERVRQAEAEQDSWHQAALLTTADLGRVERERDEARGKIDKVRERVKFHLSGQRNGSGISFILDDVLAILDGKEG